MKSQEINEFRRGVGRARALMRQAFGDWPGVPETQAGGITWHIWSPYSAPYRQANISGTHLRAMEETLSKLRNHHRQHLVKLVAEVDDWLNRTANCIELLKEFLYKPPTAEPGWAATITRMELPRRLKERALKLAQCWPDLQPLLWHLLFAELTSTHPEQVPCLAWIEAHAESLSHVAQLPNGHTLVLNLARIGPQIDPRWLRTMIALLTDPVLKATPYLGAFDYADDLSKTLRNYCDPKPVEDESENQNKPLTVPEKHKGVLAETIETLLRRFMLMKPSAVRSVTGLLGAIDNDQLCPLISAMNERGRREEKRLQKELVKVKQLGPEQYKAMYGLAHLHVKTNLREESSAVFLFFTIVSSLCSCEKHEALQHAIEFFETAQPLRVAQRLRLAREWHECGWESLAKYIGPMNNLLRRRGWHAQLTRHWQRRMLPSVASKNQHVDLVASAFNFCDLSRWQAALSLLEALVYDGNERLTEEAVTAWSSYRPQSPTLRKLESFGTASRLMPSRPRTSTV